MLVALLLYGYSRGIYSSRQLARACEERVDMMAVTGLNQPDFRTISDFRKRHLPALQQLFVQVLRLCQAAGLVKLGHVAVDDTKLKGNASKHKSMSYKHMVSQEPKLAAEVASWLDGFRQNEGQAASRSPPLRRRAVASARSYLQRNYTAGVRQLHPTLRISTVSLKTLTAAHGSHASWPAMPRCTGPW